MRMAPRTLSRFKLKQRRRKNPEVRILIASDIAQDPLLTLAKTNIATFERLAADLYDVHWPAWRAHGGLQISLQFLDETRMTEVNDEYRQVRAPTDVLSFPFFEKEGRFVPDAQRPPLLLGDIAVCPAVVRKNAVEHHVSVESELALIVFHGMLHLLAWDHDTPEKQERMWGVQEHFRDLFLKGLSAPVAGNAGHEKK
ncbi:MAG: rRNA maturation RNase YbeY [Pyramidobacter sp.]|uniref:rRNA maturation RNase YbeY n=1 Tax=Pyramidobacter sp. TaxID=1943581 RepID=UPI002A7FAF23|nr:rRNA maturation RNase YbeY [Pyramidobacter sp.]MDY4033623.1 rRNA maturation RNase YbeY [Pyramidobacter sp.]